MPHYWFRVPLSGTADHLKRAKQTGGAPKVKQELKKDARDTKGKALPDALLRPGPRVRLRRRSSSPRTGMTAADCNWFHEPVGHRRAAAARAERLDADETVLEPGERLDPGPRHQRLAG